MASASELLISLISPSPAFEAALRDAGANAVLV
jgi:hypothetical protein